MTEQEKKSIEYVIGIDLGHGETSAALCPLQWDVLPSQLDPAKDLEMGGNKKVMPSAITILDNGNAYIGDAAFNPEVLRHAEVRVCFKKAPKDINGELEQLMIRFMKEVYKRIRENNSGLLTDGNHVVYIATPSGWDKATQELYLQMAKEAGLPIAGVTKESRAAFVRAQHDTTSGLGRNIEKGAIVFDMGSSTLDFTYMNKNLPGLVDFGYNCGASAIEKAIYAMKREEEDCIKDFEKKFPKLVDFLVFEARKVKEQAYIDPTLRVKKTINFEDIIDDDDLEDERFRLVFQPGELNQLLEKNGYIQQIADAMTDYRENHIKGQDIYGVFMTGGASRMDFLKPMICKYFGIEEGQVYRDQDPSLTISQGVAEVARMDMRTEGMDEGIGAQIDHLIDGEEIFEEFVNIFGAYTYRQVNDTLVDTLVAFRDGNQDLSINDLRSQIGSNINQVLSNVESQASIGVEEAIKSATEELCKRVDSIVAVYTAQGNDIKLPSINVPAIRMSNINIDNALDEIEAMIPVDDSTFSGGGALGGAAAGAAIGSIIPGIGTLIGAGIGAWLGGSSGTKSAAEIASERRHTRLDAGTRNVLISVLGDKWEDIQEMLANAVEQSIRNDHKVKSAIKQASTAFLTEYRDSLKNSRILID